MFLEAFKCFWERLFFVKNKNSRTLIFFKFFLVQVHEVLNNFFFSWTQGENL